MKNYIAKLRGRLFLLKCKVLRKDVQIGHGLRIYKKIFMIGNGKIIIGANCIVDGIIGDNSQYVTIDTHSSDAVISIGDNAKLYAARISARFQIKIGNDLMIEEAGIVDTDFHSIEKGRELPPNENKHKCEVKIGNRVCICARSMITKGVKIEDDVIIGPGSVVTGSIKSRCFVLGNPAKQVRI